MSRDNSIYYVLMDRIAVPVWDLLAWGVWFRTHFRDHIVAGTRIGPIEISTVFLGIDRNYARDVANPHLFETMIFRGGCEAECVRCSTWQQAEAQHKRAVDLVRAEIIEMAKA